MAGFPLRAGALIGVPRGRIPPRIRFPPWKPKSWAARHRIVVIRRRVPVSCQGPLQLNLFEPRAHGFEFKAVRRRDAPWMQGGGFGLASGGLVHPALSSTCWPASKCPLPNFTVGDEAFMIAFFKAQGITSKKALAAAMDAVRDTDTLWQ